ncbi:MAG: hypothetical protein BMS9Abin26_0159 [Gammaproteobacteria bacterium]|nr:MAG: hypothetical protein BMS9Abin26_0159 [Gammaproteobacteria bacterium]
MTKEIYSLLTWLLLLFIVPMASSADAVFRDPQPVIIHQLPTGSGGTPISTEEPFVSRDGRFLFFNTAQDENQKDLHYAERSNEKWVYRGEIGPNINTKKEVEGNPTMDNHYTFLYVDSGIESMVRVGRFVPGTGELKDLKDFTGVPDKQVELFAQQVHGNMSVEISPSGDVIYYSRASWDLNGLSLGLIQGADIFFVTRYNRGYVYDEAKSRRIMKNINSPELDYAASISSDGLEIFFTRMSLSDMKPGKIRSRILMAKRKSVSEPFSKPVVIEAIGRDNFVEGPSITNDGRELYYHKRVGRKFRIFKVSR